MESSSRPVIEGYLKTIANHTEARPSFNIIVSDNTSSIRTTFSPALDFPKGCNYEMALSSLETYYSFPNIDASNNSFTVSTDKKQGGSLLLIYRLDATRLKQLIMK